jgi:hypothetical protein
LQRGTLLDNFQCEEGFGAALVEKRNRQNNADFWVIIWMKVIRKVRLILSGKCHFGLICPEDVTLVLSVMS